MLQEVPLWQDKTTCLHYACDLWTASFSSDQFMGHIVSWISPSFEMFTVCLDMTLWTEAKTATNQREQILEVFKLFAAGRGENVFDPFLKNKEVNVSRNLRGRVELFPEWSLEW